MRCCRKKKKYIVAVDGPAGAGKSTVCDGVAEKLGILHLDTGATYRTLALGLLRKNIDISDVEAVRKAIDEIAISIGFEDGVQIMYMGDENVNGLIRTNEVSMAASACAVIPEVRLKMTELQRKTAKKISMIVDGRDIGTYVFPDADYKFYITAEVSERARRRMLQNKEKGIESDIKQLEEEIAARDYNDMNRKMAPLRQAEDAVLIDTTEMTQAEVEDKMLSLIKEEKK